ncbi:hypothetical protein O1611_g10190 [Lasiodiplodia mahajangana]|uniref:Uncharacterized protein n=1 Tax=Lasiodiplodia mahajangana TaxID=1108764 RepID=A0ACC2J0X6_9PEZI|nr:hypothetical protein O1611_g10190 [Lasiodiplodia mahajangana]
MKAEDQAFNLEPHEMLGVVPGVTPQNLKNLTLRTENVREVANMTIEELNVLIGKEAARKVHGFFNRNLIDIDIHAKGYWYRGIVTTSTVKPAHWPARFFLSFLPFPPPTQASRIHSRITTSRSETLDPARCGSMMTSMGHPRAAHTPATAATVAAAQEADDDVEEGDDAADDGV